MFKLNITTFNLLCTLFNVNFLLEKVPYNLFSPPFLLGEFFNSPNPLLYANINSKLLIDSILSGLKKIKLKPTFLIKNNS